MGSAQAEHVLVKMTVTSLDRTTKGTEVDDGVGRRTVNRKEYKTHETKVALLPEVTDAGGRLSTGLEDVEWEDAEVPLRRLADIFKWSDEEG
jgi:hypothetical protein